MTSKYHRKSYQSQSLYFLHRIHLGCLKNRKRIKCANSSKQRVLLISSHHPDICFKSSTDEQGQMRRIRSCIKHVNKKDQKGVPTPSYQLVPKDSRGIYIQKNERVPVSARVSLLSVSSKQKLDFRAAWSTCKPTNYLSELTSWLHSRTQSQCKKSCEKQNIGARKAHKSLELQL